jgi:hypothetical protein
VQTAERQRPNRSIMRAQARGGDYPMSTQRVLGRLTCALSDCRIALPRGRVDCDGAVHPLRCGAGSFRTGRAASWKSMLMSDLRWTRALSSSAMSFRWRVRVFLDQRHTWTGVDSIRVDPLSTHLASGSARLSWASSSPQLSVEVLIGGWHVVEQDGFPSERAEQ